MGIAIDSSFWVVWKMERVNMDKVFGTLRMQRAIQMFAVAIFTPSAHWVCFNNTRAFSHLQAAWLDVALLWGPDQFPTSQLLEG